MTDPTPPEPTKITRARATTSGVPRRAARPTSRSTVPEIPTPVIEESVRAEKVVINQGGAEHVQADTVSVHLGGVTDVDARAVDVNLGGIVYANADDITVSAGGIVLARADRVNVERAAVGAAFAREAQLNQVYARSVIAQDVRINQGMVGTMLAGKATFDRPSGVLMLIAGQVDGPVKALMDWRSALAFGAAFGVVWAILRRR